MALHRVALLSAQILTATTAAKQTLAGFIREMTSVGAFGRDEAGKPLGPMPANRREARSAIGGANRGRGARKRTAMRAYKRQRGLS